MNLAFIKVKIYFQYIHNEDILPKEYYALDKDVLLLLIIKHEFQNGLITNIYHKEKLSQLKILNLVFKHGRIHLS